MLDSSIEKYKTWFRKQNPIQASPYLKDWPALEQVSSHHYNHFIQPVRGLPERAFVQIRRFYLISFQKRTSFIQLPRLPTQPK